MISKAQQTLPAFNYIPQAPTTAAFTRYGDIPVDLSTGVTSISIPIYTLSEHGMNVPISISYHASGIKVNDAASSVGLGWTLNAGGTITRTVFGSEDERVDIGYVVPDIDFVGTAIYQEDFEKKILDGARRVIENKRERKEDADLPTMSWQQFDSWLTNALQINSEIEVRNR